MKLEDQLSKISIQGLLSQLNPRTKELLVHFGILENANKKKLAKILISSLGANKILQTKNIRNSLIDRFNNEQVEELSKSISSKKKENYYEYLKKLSFKKNSKEYKVFLNFFEISNDDNNDEKIDFIEHLNLLTKPLENNTEIETFYPLFKHQIKATSDCLKILKSSRPRVFLHMPTGSGKTRTAINIMTTLLREELNNFVIVWLANKEELCDQAYEEFYKAWQIIGNQTVKIFKHYGGKRSNLKEIVEYTSKNSAVVFSSLDMMYEDLSNNIETVINLSKNTGLVVMDEAHLTIAKTYKSILENLAPTNKTAILGLSATPGRSYRNVEEDLELKNFYYGQKVGLKVTNQKNIIEWLIKNRFLAKAKIQKIDFETDLAKLFTKNEIQNELIRIRDGKDYSKRFRDKLSNDNERIELILNLIKEQSKSNEKIIVFSSSKDNAIAISDLLNIDGINSASVTSDTDPENRKKIIENFKNSKSNLNILINYDVLTTGFDAPKTKIAIITRPTTSIVLYHQMIGRVVRGKKQGGNLSCDILTVADTLLPGYKNLADSFYFWEDIWK